MIENFATLHACITTVAFADALAPSRDAPSIRPSTNNAARFAAPSTIVDTGKPASSAAETAPARVRCGMLTRGEARADDNAVSFLRRAS